MCLYLIVIYLDNKFEKGICPVKQIFSKLNFFHFFLYIQILLFIGCKSSDDSPSISFYYWKTTFKLSETEKQALKDNQVKNIYIKYFDIDLSTVNQKPIPVSPVLFEQKIENLRIIPVIYIKNKVMLAEKADMKNLADKAFDYIEQINKKHGIVCDEIQIDCDWTLKSRDNYLKFIEYFKSVSKKKLSATIRLHQVKYYLKTKIPSVDRGVLMYYNMGTIAPDSLNSIYDKKVAGKYLNSLRIYPLGLDVALPIYSWGIHISNNKVIDLINKVNESSFAGDTNFVAQNNHFFLVKNSNIKFGYYFKQNDKIKIEFISFIDLKQMAAELGQKMKNKPKEIIFYDLDSSNLNSYNNENQIFKKIVNYF
jgi:hypothetical protein